MNTHVYDSINKIGLSLLLIKCNLTAPHTASDFPIRILPQITIYILSEYDACLRIYHSLKESFATKNAHFWFAILKKVYMSTSTVFRISIKCVRNKFYEVWNKICLVKREFLQIIWVNAMTYRIYVHKKINISLGKLLFEFITFIFEILFCHFTRKINTNLTILWSTLLTSHQNKHNLIFGYITCWSKLLTLTRL